MRSRPSARGPRRSPRRWRPSWRRWACDARVVVAAGPEESDLEVSVVGEGTSALVGRGGETIDALQYLLGQVASRAEGGNRRRVSLDADGYRARREAALVELAEQAAQEAVEFGDEIELDAMTPHDRRIVHMALKDRPGS